MSNIDQVVHRWAQFPNQRKKTGKCGNVSYDNAALSSYWAEIGRFTGEQTKDNREIVLISRRGYSHTTSGHQSCASSASRHHFQIYVRDWTSSYRFNWKETILREHLAEISATIAGIEKSRKPIDLLSSIARDAGKICRIIDECKAKLPKQKNFTLPAIRKLAGARLDRETYIKRHFYPDIAERIAKHEKRIKRQDEITAKCRATRAEKWRLRQEQYAKQHAEREAREKIEFELWKSGELEHRTFYNVPMTLRVRGNQIETSRGASVPVNAALMLYDRLTTAPETVAGFAIGDFTVRDFIGSNGDRVLRVGCHDIPFTEIERIRGQLP